MIIVSSKIAGRLPKALYSAIRRINRTPLQMGGLPALASNYIAYIVNDQEWRFKAVFINNDIHINGLLNDRELMF